MANVSKKQANIIRHLVHRYYRYDTLALRALSEDNMDDFYMFDRNRRVIALAAKEEYGIDLTDLVDYGDAAWETYIDLVVEYKKRIDSEEEKGG